ncbi:prospero related homeodomain protein [Aphelenchoides avenae]|nr:prospero related homeodomain protein [Aphelenchus avenae]
MESTHNAVGYGRYNKARPTPPHLLRRSTSRSRAPQRLAAVAETHKSPATKKPRSQSSMTAELAKWFSNFRELFYMQMEKYAKQAIAEGIRDKNDIVVTIESEIYKQLNQHYNRNSVIEVSSGASGFAVQETLRELFVALQANKDAEPSWKKAIYKVMQQLDEQIPECFEDANFMENLERQQTLPSTSGLNASNPVNA